MTTLTATALLVGLLSAQAVALSPLALPDLQKTDPVPVSKVGADAASGKDETAGKEWKSIPDAAWPKPAEADGSISGKSAAQLKAGTLPVRVTPTAAPRGAKGMAPASGDVGIEVLDRKAAEKAGIDGVVFAVDSTGGVAELAVDYGKFRNAIGGDWASRLTLVQLTDCGENDTASGKCTVTPLKDADNNEDTARLTAKVSLEDAAEPESDGGQDGVKPQASTSKLPGASPSDDVEDSASPSTAASPSASPESDASPSASPSPTAEADKTEPRLARTLFAVTSKPSGAGGDYKASSLSPSGEWQAGDSTGAFTWSYPIDTPNVAGELGPELSLDYSSTALDGRTAATNNQANNIGDGFTLEPGFVERRYKACNTDMTGGTNKARNGDLCWGGENAVLSLGGSTNELVKDDASGKWKLKHDDGSKVELLKDTGLGNGDADGEYWKVTDTKGVQYFFGRHKLPGWADGKETTNSTWTVPVFGNHSGEPCYNADFSKAWCQQAWRWNLDYVVDPHGDAMAYYWGKETNHYGRNVNLSTGKGTATAYARGGYLKRIDYGLRSSNMYTGTPAAKVTFGTAERCVKTSSFDCAESKFTAANASHWPDVPFDLYCAPGTECKTQFSPSFWSRKRITNVTTEVRDGSAYKKVDTFAFDQNFPSTGDGSSPALWLKSIQRTGHTGGTDTALPKIDFKGVQLENRVDATGDGIPPLIRYRISAVHNEMGGTTAVTYTPKECTRASLPGEEGNTKRCYPVYWSSPDSPGEEYKPVKDWFHTYAVTQVREEDKVASSPAVVTDYTYTGGVAWAKSQDPFTEAKYRTYSDFRGYARVKTSVGTGTDGAKQISESRYFRGIPGAKVPDSEGNEATDHPAFAGMTRDEATFNGSKVVEASASVPWKSAATATHKRGDSLPDLQAFHVDDAATETTRTAVGAGWRRTKVERTFDSYGMLATESDHGDTAKGGDEQCTTTTYARNTGANMVEFTSAVKTVAKACGTTPNLPDDLISEKRTYFDGSTTLGAAPSKGDVTRTDEQNAAGTGMVTVASNKVDQHGRTLESTDAAGNKTTTAFTPATQYAVTKKVTTNALGHSGTEEFEPGRGAPVGTVDANGKRTDAVLDGLGRTIKAWEAAWPKAAHPETPSKSFEYAVSTTKPSVVTTKTLTRRGEYRTEYTFTDGLGRKRETQTPDATEVGRLITEHMYDSRGLEWKSYDGYYATGKPTAELVTGDDTKTPRTTRTTYDGAGRPTVQISEKYGDEQTRTTTQYGGDRETVIPPKGDTATTTVKDAQGRTTELIQYTNADRTKSQSTTYTYTPSGQTKQVTDPTGAKWITHYDHRDRPVKVEDPDKGTYTTTFDNLDRPVTVTDARGKALTTVYDKLGRKTEMKEGSTVRASWTYDTVAKGQLTKSVRHEGGQDYVNEVTALNDRYQATGTKITIPEREGALAGSYTFTSSFNAQTGLQDWLRQPALPGQLGENFVYRYGPSDQLVGAGTTASVLINNRIYNPYGQVLRTEYGRVGQKVWASHEYDEHTGALTRTTTDRETGPARIDDIHYTYDQAQNLTQLKTASGQDEQKQTDTQCFTTDALRRITNAWTATDSCAAKPNADGTEGGTAPKVGGPDAYWHSYTYDAIGNRTTETQHKVDGNPLADQDVTRTYHYGQNDAGKRQLTGIDTTTGGKTTTASYAYDKAGNTTKREDGDQKQDLAWDPEGHLATLTEQGKDTSYVYDADGNRLIAKTPGKNTLYLPGGNELTDTNGTKATARYYSAGDETIAVKASNQTNLLLNDHTGTATVAVLQGAGQTITRRKMTIFGGERTAQPATWPGSKGFVGGTQDNTGLTHLGAREYDPALGRFISVDPIMDTADPQQMHGYTYGNNNPLIHSDPDGMFFGKIIKWAKKMAAKIRSQRSGWGGFFNGIRNVVKSVVSTARKYVSYVSRNSSYFTRYSGPNRSSARPVYGPFTSDYARDLAQARADAAAQKARDEQRQRDNQIKQNTQQHEQPKKKSGGFGGWLKDTFGTWDGWKNRVLPAAGFATCVVASAGVCAAAGAGIALGTFTVEGRRTGSWEFANLGESLAWTAFGAGAAFKYARWGGATSREAMWGSAIARNSVRVKPATTTSGAVWSSGSVNWSATRGNMYANTGFNFGFCGAGSFSAGKSVGSC
ncbi:RHS repeat-associated core domain-containing protein [Streptomyces sp. TRM66268-LWL]|uniref:RHS repeat-associated core domain-containing protein n=1 Tax=Streptomyces polyasparticus TaxID=2767826 RepID=A0ABR7STZ0_9ACTN|nr:RHS repeat-associated core domain-containing protein [Streptomyces polyasparticus]MBC9718863.1 RHS repeat-associated core domain-containing protein [Streptomyces polyasparticus]